MHSMQMHQHSVVATHARASLSLMGQCLVLHCRVHVHMKGWPKTNALLQLLPAQSELSTTHRQHAAA